MSQVCGLTGVPVFIHGCQVTEQRLYSSQHLKLPGKQVEPCGIYSGILSPPSFLLLFLLLHPRSKAVNDRTGCGIWLLEIIVPLPHPHPPPPPLQVQSLAVTLQLAHQRAAGIPRTPF